MPKAYLAVVAATAGVCGHRHGAVEVFLGRVSKGQKSIALGEAVTEGIAAGKEGAGYHLK